MRETSRRTISGTREVGIPCDGGMDDYDEEEEHQEEQEEREGQEDGPALALEVQPPSLCDAQAQQLLGELAQEPPCTAAALPPEVCAA